MTPYVLGISVECVEIWGPASIAYNSYGAYTCKAWGHAYEGPAAGQYRLVGTPVDPAFHPFMNFGTEYTYTETLDAGYFTFRARGLRPTNPVNHTTLNCYIDGQFATAPLTITGATPTLAGVWIEAPSTTVAQSLDLQLVGHYDDNYGFTDQLQPIPPHSWQSSNTSVASVDGNGKVHGVGAGSVVITFASGTKSATKTITVTAAGCSLATTPSGTVNTFQGGRVDLSATATCFGGAVLPSGNWTWPITGPISVWNDNSQNSLVHIVGEGPGTATAKVCTPAGANQVCSAPITFQLYATRITSALDGSTQTPGINASGSIVFTITNVSPIAGTSTVSCTGGYGSVACNGVTPTSVTLQPNESKTATATWSSGITTGPGSIQVSSTGGGNDGIAFDITGGAMTTSINYGPSSVRPGVNCEWMASANGGTPPYTYQWTVNGDPVSGSGNDLYYVNLRRNFTLGITTTDANGVTATDSKAITVTSSAPYCPL